MGVATVDTRVCRQGHSYIPGRGCPACARQLKKWTYHGTVIGQTSEKTAGQRPQKSADFRSPVPSDPLSQPTTKPQVSVSHLGVVGRRSKADLEAWAKRAHRPLRVIIQWDRDERTCSACNLIFESWDDLVGHRCDGFTVHRPRPIPASKVTVEAAPAAGPRWDHGCPACGLCWVGPALRSCPRCLNPLTRRAERLDA